MSVPQKKGEALLVAKDEGVRGDTTAESLGALRPIMKGGVVTAGTGPRPIVPGWHPTADQPTRNPIGVRPSASSLSSATIKHAAAASFC